MGSRPNPRELFVDATLGKSHIIIVLQVQPELRRAKRLAEAQRRMAVMKFPALAHLCICIRATPHALASAPAEESLNGLKLLRRA
jgi:hypothetical protein